VPDSTRQWQDFFSFFPKFLIAHHKVFKNRGFLPRLGKKLMKALQAGRPAFPRGKRRNSTLGHQIFFKKGLVFGPNLSHSCRPKLNADQDRFRRYPALDYRFTRSAAALRVSKNNSPRQEFEATRSRAWLFVSTDLG
jgi:hypothetical protein